VFAVVGGGLRWQKIDGGRCSGDCSSSSLCRGSSLCFSLYLSVLIDLSHVTVFVSSPLSLCLLFLVSLLSLLCSPLFSLASPSFFFSSVSLFYPFCSPSFPSFFFSFMFLCSGCSFFLFNILRSLSLSSLSLLCISINSSFNLSSFPLVFILFFLPLFCHFPFFFLSISAPSFLLCLSVFIGKRKEIHPVLSGHGTG